MNSGCIFCKIVKGDIPCYKVFESGKVLAFMDINPIAKNHVLVIPKTHAMQLHEVPADDMAEVGVALKKVAKAIGTSAYNILQNNGRIAHQEVDHVHFHVIPKDETQGLGIKWPTLGFTSNDAKMCELKQAAEALQSKLE